MSEDSCYKLELRLILEKEEEEKSIGELLKFYEKEMEEDELSKPPKNIYLQLPYVVEEED